MPKKPKPIYASATDLIEIFGITRKTIREFVRENPELESVGNDEKDKRVSLYPLEIWWDWYLEKELTGNIASTKSSDIASYKDQSEEAEARYEEIMADIEENLLIDHKYLKDYRSEFIIGPAKAELKNIGRLLSRGKGHITEDAELTADVLNDVHKLFGEVMSYCSIKRFMRVYTKSRKEEEAERAADAKLRQKQSINRRKMKSREGR